jgi:hypothetical protein
MKIDDPAIIQVLSVLAERYESALMSNDLPVLDSLFWQSAKTVRFGVGENLYGIDEVVAFRARRRGGSPQRSVIRRTITTFGDDFGVVNVEFQRNDGGPAGRQSQSWVRLQEGWQIVSAHVSLIGGRS